jgi:hypothetical protein
VQPPASEELALAALEWIEATAEADGDRVWWSGKPSSAEPDPTLYHGTAGIVLALLEADAHFGDRRWGELALRGTRWLAASVDTSDTASHPALYAGSAGTAFALHEAAGRLGADGANRDEAETARAAAMRGLAGVRAAFDGERWGDAYELMFGNAGIGLVALRRRSPRTCARLRRPGSAKPGSSGAVSPRVGTTFRTARWASRTRSRSSERRSAAVIWSTPRWPASPTSWPATRPGRTAF